MHVSSMRKTKFVANNYLQRTFFGFATGRIKMKCYFRLMFLRKAVGERPVIFLKIR